MGPKSSKASSSPDQRKLSGDEVQRVEAALKRLIVGQKTQNNDDVDAKTYPLISRTRLEAIVHETCQGIIDDVDSTARHQQPSSSTLALRPAQVMAQMMSICLKFLTGTPTEQCELLVRFASTTSAGNYKRSPPASTSSATCRVEDMVNLVSAFVQSYLSETVGRNNEPSWRDGVEPTDTKVIKTITAHLVDGLEMARDGDAGDREPRRIDLEAVEKWYQRSPLAAHFIYSVFRTAFKMSDPSINNIYTPLQNENWTDEGLLPACDKADWTKFKSILTMADVLLLNHQLPAPLRQRWRYLFSSRQYGESFSQLLGRIVARGPTLVIMRNYKGETFGGFASESWKLLSKFYGTSECFLFTLRPRMAIFRTTGYNENYMYLNVNQQTMPNGLGMGGQLEYFGLSISNYYGRGTCTRSCSTFSSQQLSSELEFDIETLEVWGVGPEPTPEEANLTFSIGTRQSALDTLDPELKAILEMTGKAPISDDIRKADQKDPSLRDTVT